MNSSYDFHIPNVYFFPSRSGPIKDEAALLLLEQNEEEDEDLLGSSSDDEESDDSGRPSIPRLPGIL